MILYILLIIIAVGVLLISEPGKRLLGWLMAASMFVFVAGLIVAVFGFLLIFFLDFDEQTKDSILAILGIVIFCSYILYHRHSIQKTMLKTFFDYPKSFFVIYVASLLLSIAFILEALLWSLEVCSWYILVSVSGNFQVLSKMRF